MDCCVKKEFFYTQEEYLDTVRDKNTKKKKMNEQNTKEQVPEKNTEVQQIVDECVKRMQKHNFIEYVVTGIVAGFLAIIGETIFLDLKCFMDIPNNIKEINNNLDSLEKSYISLQEDVEELNELEIETKLEEHDDDIKWVMNYLAQNSALKVNLVEGVSIETEMDNNDDIHLEQPTWSDNEIIAIDTISNKSYRAKELDSVPLLIPYMDDGNEVYFYGKFNENNRWNGKCILNVYKNNKLNVILEAVYNDGKLTEYKQVLAETKNGRNVWIISNRKKEDSYNSGETWTYSRNNVPTKKFTMETVEAEYIYDTEDFLTSMETDLLSYYRGNTSEGKYNDKTGQAYLVRYANDGTILTLYKGCFSNGTFNDDTYRAWEIARNPDKGAEKYLYFKGKFKDGCAVQEINNNKVENESDIPLSRIFEIVQENGITMELNWYKY